MVAFYDEAASVNNPKTLCDWVRNFRIKKLQMKRKLRVGGDLRVCAILTTALKSAEHELRRKQQERFDRWCKVQTKINSRFTTNEINGNDSYRDDVNSCDLNEKENRQSSHKQREEIDNLWKCELSGLDKFMRSMSSSSGNSHSIANCRRSSENIEYNNIRQLITSSSVIVSS